MLKKFYVIVPVDVKRRGWGRGHSRLETGREPDRESGRKREERREL